MTASDALERFLDRHGRLFVLTGAGCSTASGIPDYRDLAGAWKRRQPVSLQRFLSDPLARQRYWARSLVGWRLIRRAEPNAAHRALAALEAAGRVERLVTQNVDRLHAAAGSRNVLELHGRVDRVRCVDCGRSSSREAFQEQLSLRNPTFAGLDVPEAPVAPDGDADVDGADFSSFDVPACVACGGVVKTDVVFFGESVPRKRVESAMASLRNADAMLVVGSSLMVYSAYRFAKASARAGKPIAAINIGRTRADDLLALKIVECCTTALEHCLEPRCKRLP